MLVKRPGISAVQQKPPQPSAARPSVPQLGLAAVLGGLTFLLFQSAWQRLVVPGRPAALVASPDKVSYRVDLNLAGRGELQQLPGIGPAMADRIAEHRFTRGGFEKVEELRQIPGIGPATYERLLNRVQVGDRPSPGPASPSARPAEASGPKQPPARPIDLNLATLEELMQLPGIGPVMAERILADRRQNGFFRRIEDLTRIRGIKEKTLEKVRPYVMVAPAGGTEP